MVNEVLLLELSRYLVYYIFNNIYCNLLKVNINLYRVLDTVGSINMIKEREDIVSAL